MYNKRIIISVNQVCPNRINFFKNKTDLPNQIRAKLLE